MLTTFRQFSAMFDKAEQRKFVLLGALTTLMALIDLIGVAAVLPFLAVAADPQAAQDSAPLLWLYNVSGVSSDRGFILLLGGFLLAFILIGLAVKLVTQYSIIRFAHDCNHSFSRRLLARYLFRPYAWHLDRNSADLGGAILTECEQVVTRSLLPALRLLSQGMVVIVLVGLLLFVNPVIAIIASLGVGGCYSAIFIFVRRQISRIGQRRIEANRKRYRITQEAFGGIKEAKLTGLEGSYIARYDGPAASYVRTAATSQILGELPRFLLEAIAFGGLVLVILALLVLQEAHLADIVPVLGVFGFAILKIFPAIQQIYQSLTQMRFGAPMLEKLYEDLASSAEPKAVVPAHDQALPLRQDLVLEDLHFSYPSAGRAALTGLSLKINANSVVGIVGGTGAGKTTTVDLILGLLAPDQGRILIDGEVLSSQNLRCWQNTLGYVPQQIFLSDETVAANIALGIAPEARDHAAIERAAKLAELHEFIINELPKGYETEVGERGVRLSGGQRQRIGIARALYRDPSVLILDEATSALDTLTERAVMEAVSNLGRAKTIIMIAHRLSTVKQCDSIYLLQNGKLEAEGSFDELIRRSNTFRQMAT